MSASDYLGWHFSTGTLAHGDGRSIVAGETHEVTGDIIACERGLHASARALDALEAEAACGAVGVAVRVWELAGAFADQAGS